MSELNIAKQSTVGGMSIECPICGGESQAYDVVDFNKSCAEAGGQFLPLSGLPVYYHRCEECGFVHAPSLCEWSDKQFLENIYNDQYIDVDPDYVEARPQKNLKLVEHLFLAAKPTVSHLDYGGGNGRLSELLNARGWRSTSFDPFPQSTPLPEKTFDLVTAFEVFEHVPNARDMLQGVSGLMSDNSVLLFSTLLSDGILKPQSRINWRYCAPRNGHISLFSQRSLQLLGEQFGLRLISLSRGVHAYIKGNPTWRGRNSAASPPNPTVTQKPY